MKKWNILEQATAPDGSAISLQEHDGQYAIRVNGRELMSTRRSASEEALANVACAHLAKAASARVLIGGLGLGFTLRAALKSLSPTAKVIVAEIMPPVVEWNKNRAYPLAADAVEDARTEIQINDVADVLMRTKGGFDAVMLDADNNTTAMNTEGNRSLYDETGLAIVHSALRQNGCAVYWSADSDPRLAKRMGRIGFTVEQMRVPAAHATGGGMHTLIVGRKRR